MLAAVLPQGRQLSDRELVTPTKVHCLDYLLLYLGISTLEDLGILLSKCNKLYLDLAISVR